MSDEVSSLDRFQDCIGYHFQDAELLLRALTHPSYVNEHPEEGSDNQRLEFLGDAVLGFIVAAWVFERYPSFHEGEMTRLRAALVCEETLARFAAQLGLGEALRLGRGEEEGGGRERPANLGDGFEALVGALYLDGGLEQVQRLLHGLIEPAAEAILSAQADKDAKSRLQEWAQGELGVTPRYRIVAESGPDHAKTFAAEVLLDREVVGRGRGHSKQAAERAAAQEALENVEREAWSEKSDVKAER
ncbi:MAG TPA: ribonuclease III [Chloroflexi bacterium]|nr:ribonuclease III [Chloroflexota bacterium]